MALLNLLFPRRCVGCGKIGSYFCKKCFSEIDFISRPFCPVCKYPAIDGATHLCCFTPHGLDGMYAAFRYRGSVRQAINLLKYKYVSDIKDALVDLLFLHYPKFIPKFDLVTSVPLHPNRRKQRGFNQSALLAEAFGKKLNVCYRKDLIRKVKNTKPQVKLKGKQRSSNLKGAFSYAGTKRLNKEKIVLVDDVATTRSTLFECAKVLKRNGAGRVWGVVLAHG